LAGLGELPAAARAPVRGEVRTVRVAIIGAGPAGVAAARAAGPGALLIERNPRPVELDLPPAETLLESECVGLYANDTRLPGNALLAVRRGSGLLAIAAEKVICANGGASQPLPFPGVDRPGVYA